MHTRARTKEGTRFALVALLFVLFLTLAACGGQGGAGESAAPAPEQAPATAVEAGAETASLHFVDAETGSARTNGTAPVYSAPGGRELYLLPADSPVQVLAAAAEEAEAAEAQWLLITYRAAPSISNLGWVEASAVDTTPAPEKQTAVYGYEPGYARASLWKSAPVYQQPSENAAEINRLDSGQSVQVITGASTQEQGVYHPYQWLLVRYDSGDAAASDMGWICLDSVRVSPVTVKDGARCRLANGEAYTAQGEAPMTFCGYDEDLFGWVLSGEETTLYVENISDLLFPGS